jgi:hypothetical protein
MAVSGQILTAAVTSIAWPELRLAGDPLTMSPPAHVSANPDLS